MDSPDNLAIVILRAKSDINCTLEAKIVKLNSAVIMDKMRKLASLMQLDCFVNYFLIKESKESLNYLGSKMCFLVI